MGLFRKDAKERQPPCCTTPLLFILINSLTSIWAKCKKICIQSATIWHKKIPNHLEVIEENMFVHETS